MAMTLADISIAINGDIRLVNAAADNASVLEFYRLLMDKADDETSLNDDFSGIAFANPAKKVSDEQINLLDHSANGGPVYSIDQALSEKLYGGSISQRGGNDLYAGLDMVGTVEAGTEPQIVQDGALVTSFWATGINADPANNIVSRMVVLVRSGGVDVDSKKLRIQAREYGDTFSTFDASMSVGVTIAPINTKADPNNQTASATVSAYAITNLTEGYNQIDCSGDGVAEDYYSNWDLGPHTKADFYEYAKWVQSRGSGQALYGMSGELFRGVSHSVEFDNLVGTFAQNEVVNFGNGATGAVLALDADTLWIQLLSGAAPADNDTIVGETSAATADVNGAPLARTLQDVFVGQLAGTNLVGAYGLGVVASYLSASDRVTDLDGNICIPPNLVDFVVNGLEVGDRVLVAVDDAAALEVDYDQMQLATALSGAAEVAIVMAAPIPTNAPASGSVRVFDDNGHDIRCDYTSYAGSTFTIAATDFSANNAAVGNNAFVGYLDLTATGNTHKFTSVVSATETMRVKVRRGSGSSIEPFTGTADLTVNGGSINVTRIND